MTGLEFQTSVERTNDHRAKLRLGNAMANTTNFDKAQLINACLGLSGESGEVCDAVKKHIFHEKGIDANAILLELSDVAYYVALAADAMGFTMDDVMKANKEKLEKRYPDGFDPKRAHEQGAENG